MRRSTHLRRPELVGVYIKITTFAQFLVWVTYSIGDGHRVFAPWNRSKVDLFTQIVNQLGLVLAPLDQVLHPQVQQRVHLVTMGARRQAVALVHDERRLLQRVEQFGGQVDDRRLAGRRQRQRDGRAGHLRHRQFGRHHRVRQVGRHRRQPLRRRRLPEIWCHGYGWCRVKIHVCCWLWNPLVRHSLRAVRL